MAVASAVLDQQSSHEPDQSEPDEVIRAEGVCEKTHSWILGCAVGRPLLRRELVVKLAQPGWSGQSEGDL